MRHSSGAFLLSHCLRQFAGHVMSHPEFLKQKFEKAGVQRAEPSDGVRGAPEKFFFSFFSRAASGGARGERSGAQPHTPGKGLAALCNPASQADRRILNVSSKNSG